MVIGNFDVSAGKIKNDSRLNAWQQVGMASAKWAKTPLSLYMVDNNVYVDRRNLYRNFTGVALASNVRAPKRFFTVDQTDLLSEDLNSVSTATFRIPWYIFLGEYFHYGSCECIVLRVKAWAKSQHRCGWCVKSIALHWTHLQICTKMSIIKIGSAFIRQFPFISRTIRSVVSLRVLYFI